MRGIDIWLAFLFPWPGWLGLVPVPISDYDGPKESGVGRFSHGPTVEQLW
jgi:hypothetical protein